MRPVTAVGVILVVALALVPTSCSESRQRVSREITGCSQSGARVVANASEASVELHGRFGAVDERGGVTFGSITDLGVNDEGHVFVLDGMSSTVLVLGAAGNLLYRFGRSGSGPGEFEAPWKLAVLPADTVLVLDAGLWRLTYFSPTGEVLRTERLEPDVGMGQIPELDLDATGRVYRMSFGLFEKSLLERVRGERQGLGRGDVTLERWSGSEWIQLDTVPGEEVWLNSDAGAIRSVPFPRRPLWAASRTGFWYGDNSDSRVVLHTDTGVDSCVITLDGVSVVAVSPGERAAYYDPQTLPGMNPQRLQRLRESRKNIPMPTAKPPLAGILVSSEGDVWLRVTSPETIPGEVWYRTSSGRTTRASFPPGFQLMHVQGSTAYGIYRDSLRVQFVDVYEVSR